MDHSLRPTTHILDFRRNTSEGGEAITFADNVCTLIRCNRLVKFNERLKNRICIGRLRQPQSRNRIATVSLPQVRL